MITRIIVDLKFPIGASFNSNINIIVFKKLLMFIKKLSCISKGEKCENCSFRDDCSYYWISGENFKGYSGIIIENEFFNKNIFKKQEIKKFEFYLIGDVKLFSNYIELFFNNLNQSLCNNYFYFHNYETKTLHMNEKIKVSNIVTPIENLCLSTVYNEMINYYNKKYHTDFIINNENINLSSFREVSYKPIMINNVPIYYRGFIGSIKESFLIDNVFEKIGIGKFNFLGGGKIETKNNIKL